MKRAWEVSWTTDVPVNEFGDCEPDMGKNWVKYFATESAAIKYAEKVSKLCYWKCAHVCEVEWLEDLKEWEGCGKVVEVVA